MKTYKYDIVGSFLRPDYLKEAREKYSKQEIGVDELKTIEDKAIKELVQQEKALGLKAVTDGEFRRRYWHLDFLASLIGIKEIEVEKWSVDFKDKQPKAATIKIIDKIDFDENSMFLNHFDYLKDIAGNDVDVKMTIPSPAMLHLICCVRATDYQAIDLYKDESKLYEDITLAYQKIIKTFYNHGCRYLQLYDTSWGEFCDENKRNAYMERGLDVNKIGENYVEMINKVLEAKPEDMVISIHICRGNFRSTWFSSGGYEPVGKILFSNCNVDAFFLEYDSDRSGDFEPLRYIKDQEVVLGLISSKFPQLEEKEAIKERIKEASKYIPLNQLSLSPQCGFSSTEEGNELTIEDQWKKLKLIKEIAEEVWN